MESPGGSEWLGAAGAPLVSMVRLVRYRDQPTVEVEQRVAGDPAVIWALVTDIELPARYSSELQSVEWVQGHAVERG